MNKTNKSNYYNHNLNIKKGDLPGDKKFDSIYSDRKMWGTVKELTNSSKQVPPRSLSVDGHMVTSLKKICNVANNFYVKKTGEYNVPVCADHWSGKKNGAF